MDSSLGFDLLVAALVGMAVGLEREWSGHTTGPDARFAGLRTFTLLGAIGGFGGWFIRLNQPVIAGCVIGGAILFIAIAYAATMRRPGTTSDGTTEVAAMLVVATGIASGTGSRTLAAAVGALAVLLLAEKSALQRWLQRIDAAELRATLQFAVLALVVLPILPAGAYGPYGAFQPRQLWSVVLLFSALNFAGYIARRLVGETRGLGITGLLGGMVSSTAVTFTFSRRSRHEAALALPLAFGVVAACTVLLPRVLIMASVLQPGMLVELLPLLAPAFVAGVVVLAVAYWRERETRPLPTAATASGQSTVAPADRALPNPLALGTSVQMAIAFQFVLFIIAWVHATIGSPGVLASAALLGLTDMDALTLSMSRLADDAAQRHVAGLAIAIGVIANSLLKTVFVVVLGSERFRLRAAFALLLLAASTGAALWWQW
ncbi:MAG: MgtC/SapB family protein [Gemmatimonadaceae bacterium]|nr:MgtC/SapB family protein [Gemmatimonadaceae bacterium]